MPKPTPSWVRRLFAVPSAGRAASLRTALETLEDRTVPATYTVTTLADTGYGSLRSAVASANVVPDADTIAFAPGLAGGTVRLSSVGSTSVGASALEVTSPVTIVGSGVTIARAEQAPAMRLFRVAPGGNLALKQVTLTGGIALGGDGATANPGGSGGGGGGLGGAVMNEGVLTLSGTTVVGNVAQGGRGGGRSNDGAFDLRVGYAGGPGGGPSGGLGGGIHRSVGDLGIAGNGGAGGFGGGGGGGGVGAFDGPTTLKGGPGGFGGGGGGGGARIPNTGAGGVAGFGGGDGLGGDGTGNTNALGGGHGGGGGGMGGAVFNRGGVVYLENSTLTGNSALGGKGGRKGYADFKYYDQQTGENIFRTYEITAPDGVGYGGAVFNLNGSVQANNSTLAGNEADGGGGIYGLAQSGGQAATFLWNTVVADSKGRVPDTYSNPNLTDVKWRSVTDLIVLNAGGVTPFGGAGNLVERHVLFPADIQRLGIAQTANPQLGPLADNGGPVFTMALRDGSPARNAGVNSGAFGRGDGPNPTPVPLAYDARGAHRINATVDIGAYEDDRVVVTTLADEDDGTSAAAVGAGTSLREALASGQRVTFAPGLGGTISLTRGELTVANSGWLPTSVAGPAADRLTVDVGGRSRGLRVLAGSAVSLAGLTITRGSTAGLGGGIWNQGTLWLWGVEVSGSAAGSGGGVASGGTLTVARSTLAGNAAAGDGGGLYSTGRATLADATLAGNTAARGGGVFSGGTLAATNVTVAANAAAGGGGGVYTTGRATLTNALVAANRRGGAADDVVGPLDPAGGHNLVGGADPRVGPLADNGGPTRTVALLAGSPAVGGGTPAGAAAADQRGYPRRGAVDIGAYERGDRLVVTTLADEDDRSPDPAAGAGTSLREAVDFANRNPGADAVAFAPGLAGTIALGGTQLPAVRDDLTITGPGADRLTVDAAGRSRAFEVAAGTVGISALKVVNGWTLGAGGGILNRATLWLWGVEVSGSAAGSGGGVASGGTLTVARSTLAGNAAAGDGGGLYSTGRATLADATLAGNTAARGGGVFSGGTLAATNVTVAANAAAGGGGGVYTTGRATLTNALVAANRRGGAADDVVGPLDPAGGHNLVGGADPRVGPLADNGGPTRTVALLAGSPAVGGGTPAGAAAADQRGYPRRGAVDIGAYERGDRLVVTTLADEDDRSPDPAAGAGTSLREAVDFANRNPGADAVAFAPGLAGTIALGGTQLPAVRDDLTITGPGADRLTVDAAGRSRAFEVLNAGIEVLIAGLTITGGASERGGAVRNSGGILTIRDSVLSRNTSRAGIDSPYDPASSKGGALYTVGGRLTIEGSTLAFNGALYGAGIYAIGAVTVRNSTFWKNAGEQGGAIWSSGSLLVDYSTLSGNTASEVGGIFSSLTATPGSANPKVMNSIVVGNGTDLGGNAVYSGGYNLIGRVGTGSGLVAGAVGNLVGVTDPRLGPLANNGGPTPTLALLAGSSAIDRAAVTPLVTDQRGAPRGTRPDIGAYELAPSLVAAATVAPPTRSGTIAHAPSAISAPAADARAGIVNPGDGPGDQPLAINQTARTFSLAHTDAASGTFPVSGIKSGRTGSDAPVDASARSLLFAGLTAFDGDQVALLGVRVE